MCTRGSSERHSAHTVSGSAPRAALAGPPQCTWLVQREAEMSGAAFTPSRAQAFGTWEPGSQQSSAHLSAHLDRVYLSLSCRRRRPGSEQPGRPQVSEGLLGKHPLLCRKKLRSQRSPKLSYPAQARTRSRPAPSPWDRMDV